MEGRDLTMPLKGELGLDVRSFRLDHLLFDRRGRPPEAKHQVDIQVGLGVVPPERDTILVRLEMKVRDESFMRIETAWVVELCKTSSFEFNGTEEEAWRHIAARLAPVLLYPFVRETIVSTLKKAGLDEPIPPILDFRQVFDPDSISLAAHQAGQAT